MGGSLHRDDGPGEGVELPAADHLEAAQGAVRREGTACEVRGDDLDDQARGPVDGDGEIVAVEGDGGGGFFHRHGRQGREGAEVGDGHVAHGREVAHQAGLAGLGVGDGGGTAPAEPVVDEHPAAYFYPQVWRLHKGLIGLQE